MLWDMHLPAWQTSACTIGSRNLTQSEWERFAADESYSRICPQFPVHPSVIAKNLPGTSFAAGVNPEGTGDVKREQDTISIKDPVAASATFKQATQQSLQSNDPLLSDVVCWSGATEGFAREVLPACDHAVKLAPDNGNYRDSRGLARAVSGDIDGAIQDFEYFVSWGRTTGLYTTRGIVCTEGITDCRTYIQEREVWIVALKASKAGGKAPFKDAKELFALQEEKDYTTSIWMTYPEDL
jgi:hypothetical protein